jgi:hypothetical protein
MGVNLYCKHTEMDRLNVSTRSLPVILIPVDKNKRKFVCLRIQTSGICKHKNSFVTFKIHFGTKDVSSFVN